MKLKVSLATITHPNFSTAWKKLLIAPLEVTIGLRLALISVTLEQYSSAYVGRKKLLKSQMGKPGIRIKPENVMKFRQEYKSATNGKPQEAELTFEENAAVEELLKLHGEEDKDNMQVLPEKQKEFEAAMAKLDAETVELDLDKKIVLPKNLNALIPIQDNRLVGLDLYNLKDIVDVEQTPVPAQTPVVLPAPKKRGR